MAIPEELHDFQTHRASWRNALLAARDSAAPSSDDHDDRGYWEHEIRAFDYAMSNLDKHFSELDTEAAG